MSDCASAGDRDNSVEGSVLNDNEEDIINEEIEKNGRILKQVKVLGSGSSSDSVSEDEAEKECISCGKQLSKNLIDRKLYNFTLNCGCELHKECLMDYIATHRGESEVKKRNPACPVCKDYLITEKEILEINEYEVDYILRVDKQDGVDLALVKWIGYDNPTFVKVNALPGHIYTIYLMKKYCMTCNSTLHSTNNILTNPVISNDKIFLFQCDNTNCNARFLFSRNGEVRLEESVLKRMKKYPIIYKRIKD